MVDLGEALPIESEEPHIVGWDPSFDPTLNHVVNPELVNRLLKNQQDIVLFQVDTTII